MAEDAAGTELWLRLDVEPGTDPEIGDRLTRRLVEQLRQLDVESVRPVPGDAVPAGAKASDPVTVAAVVVALSASGGVLTSVLGGVREWLGRQAAARRITVTLDGDSVVLERASAEERQQLLTAFIDRHTDG